MKKIVTFVGILWLVGSYTASAEEIQVAGSIDKTQAQVDEEISYTIRILGARGNLQAPRLPTFQGFESFYTGRTSHYTFVNGRSSASVEFTYVLVPKVAGHYTLEPVQVWIDGKAYKTQPLEVEVVGPQVQSAPSAPPQAPAGGSAPIATAPAASPPPPAAAPPQIIHDDNVFVKASVDRRTVYPNEQILLTYTLYTRYDTRYEGFEEEPSVSGFWIEDFPLEKDLGRDNVSVGGKRYVKADIRKIALFPTAPAEYTIQPGVLKVSVREEPKTTSMFDEFFGDSFFGGSSFFARRVDRLLKPESIAISARPFPENGKPASFNGAVGQFRLSASVDKNEVKQNEPVTLKLVLEGQGNVETLPRPPVPELTGYKVYEGDTSTQLLRTGETLGGKKTFEIIFIPTEAGNLSIPPLEFSFFDPRPQSYAVLHTPAFPLRVLPSNEPLRLPAELSQKEAYKKEVRLESKDIRFIHEEIPSERSLLIQRYVYGGLAGANLLGLVLAVIGLLQKRREAIFARDLGLKRRKLARAVAFRRLKQLKRLARSQKEKEAREFIEEAEKVLSEYFCSKFNVSSYSFTKEWLEEKLAELWKPEDPLVKRLREFYDLAAEARFGRGVLPSQERHGFVELIETVIYRMERVR